ncbi:phosphodiesterase [Roseovarius sp. SCSIO 43702]|uniref:glycerophosphodiester phosphodiesterase family protein n=1 Tax=Roseovarius sp. SCSIO 43702 TaxID=2823043 RepID=UPI001C7335D2|nr:glycerophosphodiester phosphodiesterase family protein [Roseovarius sp. SCSIO 43702]QYX56603.1 phosphodiesterase [Roseovarius sp. SCSIO 43702]
MIPLPDAFLRAPIAHRALHDLGDARPENSRAAIRAAIARGYGIEIDVQPSRDGRAMVFHDYDLGRLTGRRGPIAQQDADALGALALKGGDEGIPTLAEVLALVAGRVPLLIEVKDQHGQMGRTDGRLEAAIAADLAGYAGDAALMSFNPHSVIALRDLCPDRARGLVTCAYPLADWPLLRRDVRRRLREIPDYETAGASFVSHQASDLGRARVAELRAGGARVLCWTVRSEAEERVARRRADNITFEGYLAAHPA